MLSTKVIFVQYFCLSEVKGMDKNMKIAVCDSDKDFLNKVEVILQKLSKNNEVPYITFKYENSYEILYLIFNYPHKHYTFKHFEV